LCFVANILAHWGLMSNNWVWESSGIHFESYPWSGSKQNRVPAKPWCSVTFRNRKDVALSVGGVISWWMSTMEPAAASPDLPNGLSDVNFSRHCFYKTPKTITHYHLPLPETRPLPSAEGFAEGQISGSRQRRSLPSVTLGKDRHSANNLGTRQSTSMPSVRLSAKPDTWQTTTLPRVRHSAKSDTWQKVTATNGRQLPLIFAECQLTLAKTDFAKCHFLTLGKSFFFFAFCP
jgi:hypothetical protein